MFTFDLMRLCLITGWGDLGAKTADKWLEFNHLHFAGALRPLPIFFTPTTPYGHLVGWTCCAEHMTHIALCRPRESNVLVADGGTLLHEMIHQHLHQLGVSIRHADQPWRDEIARLHLQITGTPLIVSGQKVIKVRQPDGRRKSVRVQADESSLRQKDIARWPHSCGIDLGHL